VPRNQTFRWCLLERRLTFSPRDLEYLPSLNAFQNAPGSCSIGPCLKGRKGGNEIYAGRTFFKDTGMYGGVNGNHDGPRSIYRYHYKGELLVGEKSARF